MDNYKLKKFIRKFKIDNEKLVILECPNLQKPIYSESKNNEIIIGSFEKNKCDKCKSKKKCIISNKDDNYIVKININTMFSNGYHKNEKVNNNDIIISFKSEYIEKILNYMDKRYVEVQRKTKEYFDDTFDSHLDELKDILNKMIIVNLKIINKRVPEYILSWSSEVSKYFDVFENEVIGLATKLFEDKLQMLFFDLCIKYRSEKKAKITLNTLCESLFREVEEYSTIYLEEHNIFIQSLFSEKVYKLDNLIRSFSQNDENSISYAEEITRLFESKDTGKYKFIDQYQELNKIAQDKGYVHVRDNGGHGIFVNKDNNNQIVIPQGRKIGKGLSKLIQKQISGECVKGIQKNVKFEKTQAYEKIEELLNVRQKIHSLKNFDDLEKLINEHPDIFNSDDISRAKTLEFRENNIIKKIVQLQSANNIEGAIKEAKSFLYKYPNSTKMMAVIGSLYEISGDRYNTMKYYKMHIEMDGEHYDVYTRMIDLVSAQGNPEEANSYLALRNFKFKAKLNLLEEIKEAIGENKYNYASNLIKEFEKLKLSTLSADDFCEIAQSYFYANQYKLARKYCEKTLMIYSQKEEAIEMLNIMNRMNL